MSLEYKQQDNILEFDKDVQILDLFQGEYLIDQLINIEDVKGNPGENGILKITNCRLIWYNEVQNEQNLSIGYRKIQQSSQSTQLSQKKGTVKKLVIKASHNDSKYEFIFKSTNVNPHDNLFVNFQSSYDQYKLAAPYYEIKLKSSIIQKQNLVPLAQETIQLNLQNISLITPRGSFNGQLVLSNIRLVYFTTTQIPYNISIPYIQIDGVELQNTTNGQALIVSMKDDNSCVLTSDQLEELREQVYKTWQLFRTNVILTPSSNNKIVREKIVRLRTEDDITIKKSDLRRVAYQDGSQTNQGEKQIVMFSELGLQGEQLQMGVTLEDLWKILQ